jgi:hypothetical protein
MGTHGVNLLLVQLPGGCGDTGGNIGPEAHVPGLLLHKGHLGVLVLGNLLSHQVKLRADAWGCAGARVYKKEKMSDKITD